MHRTGIPVLFSILVLLIWGTAVMAQPAVDSENNVAEINLQRTVDIDADDASLPTVLSILAAESGYNIVTGPGVNKQDKISVHLQGTPIEEAMNLVVRAAGLSYEIVGNSFIVASASRLREQVGLSSYVIELQNADAEDVMKVLEDFNAEIQIEEGGNRLLVITSPKVKNEILDVIDMIDKPIPQIMLEARLIEVAVEDEEKLGINWNKLTPFETVIYEGIEAPGPFRPGEVPQQVPFQAIDDLNSFGQFGYQQPIFQLAIDYLLKNNMAEILANSQIATMNNKVAHIEVVDRIPFILSAGGVGGQVRTQTEEVGVILDIKPLINSDGFITVEVAPEVSNVFQLIGPDQNIPWVVKRKAMTTIRVKDGESIIIAGLLGINRKNTIYKVPFLGDMPFIGGMFRHKATQSRKTDLIIQITPHIISAEDPGLIKKSEMIQNSEDYFFGDEECCEDCEGEVKEVEEVEIKTEKKKDKKSVMVEEDEDLDALRDSLEQVD